MPTRLLKGGPDEHEGSEQGFGQRPSEGDLHLELLTGLEWLRQGQHYGRVRICRLGRGPHQWSFAIDLEREGGFPPNALAQSELLDDGGGGIHEPHRLRPRYFTFGRVDVHLYRVGGGERLGR
ncbi:MAG: hypothetical protein GTN78_21390 [Gemmatimonadales bacterium]|nr:hypothetical protein [Gemmatimonadales bacterium]